MEDNEIPEAVPSEWQPTTNKVDLAVLGKFAEELGECVSAVSRCIIQQITEAHPETGKINKEWLEDEIADISALMTHVEQHFHLDLTRIIKRELSKYRFKDKWFKALESDWITRTTMDGKYEINLSAAPETLVPLVRGQGIGLWGVPETRNYRIDEIASFVNRSRT